MKGRAIADINITPLVDIVLVLLIIFMVLTPLAQFTEDVSVPQVRQEPGPVPAPVLVVSQLDEKTFYINHERVKPEDLCVKIRSLLQIRRERVVFFAANEELGYQVVLDTMDRLRDSGAERIAIVSESRLVEKFRPL
jgi:biopolymer transport protein ExbD